jgi:hypothetical protein
MPYYADLIPDGVLGREWTADEAARIRTVEQLLGLRAGLNDPVSGVPPRAMNTLLIGTWNIRSSTPATGELGCRKATRTSRRSWTASISSRSKKCARTCARSSA